MVVMRYTVSDFSSPELGYLSQDIFSDLGRGKVHSTG